MGHKNNAPPPPPPPLEAAAAVVLWKLAEPVPMVSVVVTLALSALADVWRTQTVWPLLTVAALVVNVLSQPIEYSPPITRP